MVIRLLVPNRAGSGDIVKTEATIPLPVPDSALILRRKRSSDERSGAGR